MKLLLPSLLLLVLSTNIYAQNNLSTVMSYNIRCGSCDSPESQNHWEKRKFFVAHLIKTHNPDVIGLQEAELFQVEDLVEMLDHYSWMGVGREDGRDKGETTAILFRTPRFSLQGQQTLWLSPTPNQPSLGWDSALRRTLSIAKLFDAQSKQPLYVLNAHFDHTGEIARQESAKLLLGEAAKFDVKHPLIVTGDFNFTATAKSYETLTATFADAEKTSATPATGGSKTLNGFGDDKELDDKIDFVFVRKETPVQSHQIDTTTYNGLYPSDHYPIIVKVDLQVAQ